MPIDWRTALISVWRAIKSMPSTMIEPEDGSSSLLQHRKSVLLPDPDGPIKKISSCSFTDRSTPCRISLLPKLLWRPRICKIGGGTVIRCAIVLLLNSIAILGARSSTGRRARAVDQLTCMLAYAPSDRIPAYRARRNPVSYTHLRAHE